MVAAVVAVAINIWADRHEHLSPAVICRAGDSAASSEHVTLPFVCRCAKGYSYSCTRVPYSGVLLRTFIEYAWRNTSWLCRDGFTSRSPYSYR